MSGNPQPRSDVAYSYIVSKARKCNPVAAVEPNYAEARHAVSDPLPQLKVSG